MDTNLSITIDQHEISNSCNEKLSKRYHLSFDEYVSELCTKASQKLHVLARVSAYMDIIKRRTIMNAFINSQFGYCPLVWMFHSRTLNNKINKIHERMDCDHSPFHELLNRDNSFTIHARNIQALAIELYKVINRLPPPPPPPEIMNQVFALKAVSLYCSRFPLEMGNVKNVSYGTENMDPCPDEFKKVKSLPEFKRKIKQWKSVKCPCRICKT